jgi:oxygen-dependent protoporphyrinogen oxidase
VSDARVLVIGGGIAGLTVAHRLVHAHLLPGEPSSSPLPLEVTILEAESRFGGKIRTENIDGFVVDAGPDSFLTTKSAALALALELGLGDELTGTRPAAQRAFIRRGQRLCPMPPGMTGLVPGRPSAWLRAEMLGWPGRLRALLDFVLPNAAPATDESIAAFAQRRFGREACDWLLEPLLAGIHGGSGETLSLAATFPALAEAERRSGSVMRGLAQSARQATASAGEPAQRPSAFVTPLRGMQRLTDALQERLAACDLRTGARAERIERAGDEWRVHTDRETFNADIVVLASPANAAALAMQSASPRLAQLLGAIPFAASTLVHVAYDASDAPAPLEGSGYLNPRRSGRPVAACTFSSIKFEGRAPHGGLLLRTFLKGEPAAVPDDAAWRLACDEIASSTGITARPRWHRVVRYPDGMPQYTLGHHDRLGAIERELRTMPGLYLAGHSYRGIGIPDTIRSAEATAEAVLHHVGRSRANAY